jgi:hypothetical protein
MSPRGVTGKCALGNCGEVNREWKYSKREVTIFCTNQNNKQEPNIWVYKIPAKILD